MPGAHDRWPTGSSIGGVIARLRVALLDVLTGSDELATTADCINNVDRIRVGNVDIAVKLVAADASSLLTGHIVVH